MAEAKKTETPVVSSVEAPHDRVVSLSLRSDGTPDQTSPEMIGDKEASMEATKRQFAEFAVSAVDQEARREAGLTRDDEGDTSDAAIDKVKAEHEKASKAAESAAEATVNRLFRDR